MPNWIEVLNEIVQAQKNNQPNAIDLVRRKYLHKLHVKTGRNVIAYYSGFLNKPKAVHTSINDKDKSGFMLAVNKLDRSKGLDLLLHTPGGEIAATESLVDYLYSIFGKNIRAIVPQISMSAGTMIALSTKEIIMGRQSNLGPIDPQMGGLACQAILAEFENAKKEVKANPSSAPIWQVIIGKYHPTLLGACQQAIDWSEQMVAKWLNENMFASDTSKVDLVLKTFADHETQKTHRRHISKKECEDLGLNITSLESDQELQAVSYTHLTLPTICSV